MPLFSIAGHASVETATENMGQSRNQAARWPAAETRL